MMQLEIEHTPRCISGGKKNIYRLGFCVGKLNWSHIQSTDGVDMYILNASIAGVSTAKEALPVPSFSRVLANFTLKFHKKILFLPICRDIWSRFFSEIYVLDTQVNLIILGSTTVENYKNIIGTYTLILRFSKKAFFLPVRSDKWSKRMMQVKGTL